LFFFFFCPWPQSMIFLWKKMDDDAQTQILGLCYERLFLVLHYKANNMHSTVNLCLGNGLCPHKTLGHISLGKRAVRGKRSRQCFRTLFSLKKTLNVSVASNQSPFRVWTVPTRNQTKKILLPHFSLGIIDSNFWVWTFLARNHSKQFWFEHFSRSE
jgi:hypothetical protein